MQEETQETDRASGLHMLMSLLCSVNEDRLGEQVVKVNPVEPNPSCVFNVRLLTSGAAGHTPLAALAHF